MRKLSVYSALLLLFVLLGSVSLALPVRAEKLKPFILGDAPTGDMIETVAGVKSALVGQGFTLVGDYSPYEGATVICVTNDELLTAASQAENGGFGAALRLAVTKVDGNLQVSYVNPLYLGTAYGLGKLEAVSDKLAQALGKSMEFGSKGVKEEKLPPGKYHYKMMMPYFNDVWKLNTFVDHQAAVAAVEEGLAAGKGGTEKVYRIDLPGQEVTVFGIAIPEGDGLDKGAKDTDKEIMDIIDYREQRSTAYLPYELMVKGNEVIALRGKYRIAVHFPDTKMIGVHGFTAIMSAPGGIKKALAAVAGKES